MIFNKDYGTEFVPAIVGRGTAQKHFGVHKSLLCQSSQFFDSKFDL
jgi:hypothetical protein